MSCEVLFFQVVLFYFRIEDARVYLFIYLFIYLFLKILFIYLIDRDHK